MICYAVPAKVIEIKDDISRVDYGGIIKKVNHSLIEDIKVGDYILVHAGFAIEKLDKDHAKKTLEIISSKDDV